MPATLQLSAVETAADVEVPLAVLNDSARFADGHLAIGHLAIPNGERSAWRRSDDPLWIVIADNLVRLLAVLALVEIPRAAGGVICTEIKGSESLAVKRPASPVALGNASPLTIRLYEGSGTSIATELVDKQSSGILVSASGDKSCFHCR